LYAGAADARRLGPGIPANGLSRSCDGRLWKCAAGALTERSSSSS
jgi:hypothetical protein